MQKCLVSYKFARDKLGQGSFRDEVYQRRLLLEINTVTSLVVSVFKRWDQMSLVFIRDSDP